MFSRLTAAGWHGDAAALIAGALLPLAFAPFDLYAVAVLAPALLFMTWLDVPPWRAFRRGWLFGLGMFGAGVTWIFVSIHYYGHVALGLAIFLTALLVVVLAVFPALAGYLCNRLWRDVDGRALRIRLLLVMPAGWVIAEWVRGWFLTGFPWLNLGYSQIDTPLAGIAPLAGVYGVTLGVALSAGLLALLIVDRPWPAKAGYAALLAGVWLLGTAGKAVDWTTPAGDPLTVSLVQGNIPQDMKWHPDLRNATVELYRQMTREQPDSDLVIWPESALPAFYDTVEPVLAELAVELRASNTDLLAGVLYLDLPSGRYYNSMVTVGSNSGFYHKRHLVPFTEYLPLKALLGGLVAFMDVPMSDFSAGTDDQTLLQAAGHRIGISICFEDAFGEEVIMTLPEATLLVNVSNDAWFGRSIGPHQHLQIARMRAAETGRPMLRATNTGLTAIIDEQGRLTDIAPQFRTTTLTGAVQPQSGATPYIIAGNLPAVLVSLGFLILAGGLRRYYD